MQREPVDTHASDSLGHLNCLDYVPWTIVLAFLALEGSSVTITGATSLVLL